METLLITVGETPELTTGKERNAATAMHGQLLVPSAAGQSGARKRGAETGGGRS